MVPCSTNSQIRKQAPRLVIFRNFFPNFQSLEELTKTMVQLSLAIQNTLYQTNLGCTNCQVTWLSTCPSQVQPNYKNSTSKHSTRPNYCWQIDSHYNGNRLRLNARRTGIQRLIVAKKKKKKTTYKKEPTINMASNLTNLVTHFTLHFAVQVQINLMEKGKE